MLGIASYFDVKTRMVPDVIWLVFGGLGAILYVFDYESVTSYHFLAMIMGGFAAFMIWRWRLAGTADVFAVLAMTVILPVHYEFVMMTIATLAGSFIIVGLVAIIHYVVFKLLRHHTSLSQNQIKSQPFVVYLLGLTFFSLLPEILGMFASQIVPF